MQIKTFDALSFRDAIKNVKREFGPEAIILSTKEKPLPNGNGQKMIEVTAAIPAAKDRFSGASAVAKSQATLPGLDPSKLEAKFQFLETKLNNISAQAATTSHVNRLESGLHEIKMLLLESLRGQEGGIFKGIPSPIANLGRELKSIGIDDVFIVDLMKHLKTEYKQNKPEDMSADALEKFFQSHAIRWMMKKVKIAPSWSILKESHSTHMFVGATGSGKTSTVAKLAAHYHLKEKSHVVVISFDSLRLSGSEQLRLYCKIIGVPFLAVTDSSELEQAIAKNKSADLILIDTGGRSPRSEEQLLELKNIIKSDLPIETHLVLSMTEKCEQMDRTLRYFAQIGLQSLIFSKLDESWSFGEIFNLSQRWSLPLSFFSTGLRIPEDIERASKERVIERLFTI